MEKSLFNMLKEYGESDYYPFHMPGHKRSVIDGSLDNMYRYDITEIDGFDNLHEPAGILLEAQKRAASLFGSEETYFLVNGSTAGILSAISAVADRGHKLVIARNCHKSVYHAALLNELSLEYIYPSEWEEFGVLNGISADDVESVFHEIALRDGVLKKDLKNIVAAVVITSPSYEGILSDVEGIVRLAHDYQIPVIVDQAHGAHFGFHPLFPASAVSQKADFVIQSVHKTLPAPTQTDVLHHNGKLTDSNLIKKYLRVYQSSSPSYLLMAGIDFCMDILQNEGRERLENLLNYREAFWNEAKQLKNIKILPSVLEKYKNEKTVWEPHAAEPGRLVISVRGNDFTGQQLYDILLKQYHLQMEMSGADYVVAILSMMDKEEGFHRLISALIEIDVFLESREREEISAEKKSIYKHKHFKSAQKISLKKAFTASFEEILIEEAVGRTVSDFVSLYPPGIPLLVPGESPDKEAVALIKKYLENGYNVQGVVKDILNNDIKIKVVKTS